MQWVKPWVVYTSFQPSQSRSVEIKSNRPMMRTFRLGYHRHTVLDQLIVQMSHLPKQLILGDFSPKNIGVSEDYHVSLYDLDAVHHGNAVFDVGFFIGHILVHTLGKHPDLISGFLDGYREYADLVGNHLLTQLALGICLYRLANPTIPYTLAMDERQRSCLIDTIHILLGYSLLSWTATCQELARSGQGEVWHSPSTLDRL
jgi:hypothetical protein